MLLFAVFVFGLSSRPAAARDFAPPKERTDQPWKIFSFVEDAGLGAATIFNLDFERDPASRRRGTVWFATSDGLREFDGYTWRRHGRAQGLPSDFVRCVLVTASGQLWVGTDRGAGIYDFAQGTFRTHGSEAGLAGPNVRRIIEDRDGTVWFCSDSWPAAGASGGLTSYREGTWRAFHSADGLPSEYVVNFHRDRSGRAWVATLQGIAEWVGDRWRPSPVAEPSGPSSPAVNWGSANFAETAERGLFCATGRGLFLRQEASWIPQDRAPIHEHGLCATTDGHLVVCGHLATRRKAFFEWGPEGWEKVSGEFRVPADYVMDIREAPDGAIWTVGQGCLIRWPRRGAQWREFPGWPTPLLEDNAGRIWCGRLRGQNVAAEKSVRGSDERWEELERAYDHLVQAPTNGPIWGWNDHQVTRWNEAGETQFGPTDTGLATNRAGALGSGGTLWLLGHTSAGEVAVVRHAGGRWQTDRTLPELREARIWDQAAIDPSPAGAGGAWFVTDQGPQTDGRLVYVGATSTPSVQVGKESWGLYRPGLLCDASRTLWSYGDAGLFRWRVGTSTAWEAITNLPARQILDGVERGEEVWFSCGGVTGGSSGLARYSQGRWTLFPLEAVRWFGLAPGGELLVGGDGRFLRVEATPDAVPVAVDLPVPESVSALLRDRRGQYWIEAGGSVFRYQPDGIPPDTLVSGPATLIAGTPLQAEAEAIERFRHRSYRMDARFRWRLDRGPWSAESRVPIHRLATTSLALGLHELEVQGIDAGFDRDPTPARLSFRVYPLPIQSRSWFVPAVTATLLGLVAMTAVTLSGRIQVAGYARNLEARVAERTRQLEEDHARRRASEQALRASEHRFVSAFQSSPIVEAISSYPDGRYQEVNRQFTETLGYERDEVLGRTAADFRIWVHPEQRATVIAAIERGETVRGFECLIRAKSGAIRVFLTSVVRTELSGHPALLFASVDITERQAAEEALRRTMDQLRALAAHLEAVRETERTRISREVHDVLGQMLSGLKMDLRWVAKRLERAPATPELELLQDRLAEAAKLADSTIATVQRIAVELRPGALDTLGLIDALRDEARRFETRSGLRVTLDLPDHRLALSPQVATTLFRIFQELLTNVARHAQASAVEVRLEEEPGFLVLEVRDDGRGFSPQRRDHPLSLGILGMSERATSLGGRFDIVADPAGGTRATIHVPCPLEALPPDAPAA